MYALSKMNAASLPERSGITVQCSATPSQRHARAAAKYRTGPDSQVLLLRPSLAHLTNVDLDEFNLKEQVARFTAAAASNPKLYALKLGEERKKQMEEQQMERVNWEQIL